MSLLQIVSVLFVVSFYVLLIPLEHGYMQMAASLNLAGLLVGIIAGYAPREDRGFFSDAGYSCYVLVFVFYGLYLHENLG